MFHECLLIAGGTQIHSDGINGTADHCNFSPSFCEQCVDCQISSLMVIIVNKRFAVIPSAESRYKGNINVVQQPFGSAGVLRQIEDTADFIINPGKQSRHRLIQKTDIRITQLSGICNLKRIDRKRKLQSGSFLIDAG